MLRLTARCGGHRTRRCCRPRCGKPWQPCSTALHGHSGPTSSSSSSSTGCLCRRQHKQGPMPRAGGTLAHVQRRSSSLHSTLRPRMRPPTGPLPSTAGPPCSHLRPAAGRATYTGRSLCRRPLAWAPGVIGWLPLCTGSSSSGTAAALHQRPRRGPSGLRRCTARRSRWRRRPCRWCCSRRRRSGGHSSSRYAAPGCGRLRR